MKHKAEEILSRTAADLLDEDANVEQGDGGKEEGTDEEGDGSEEEGREAGGLSLLDGRVDMQQLKRAKMLLHRAVRVCLS
jgi:hypothetical protein